MRKKLLLLIALLSATTSFSQTSTGVVNYAPNNAPSSAQSVPVNLYSGTPMVSIPISSISEGSLNVNVGLKYNAAGIRAGEVADWTGLGWQLTGIPMLNRVVHGLPDEGMLYMQGANVNPSRTGYYFYPYAPIPVDTRADNDYEPDMFTLDLGGASYSFMFDDNRKAHFFPENDIQVDVLYQDNPEADNILPKAQEFTKFTFTLPDGTKYIFTNDNTEKMSEIEVHDSQNLTMRPGYTRFGNFLKCNEVVNTWYVKQIISPFGQAINFSYNPVLYSYFKLAENEATGSCPTTIEKKINRVFVRGSAINKIEGINQRIYFNDGRTTCITMTNPVNSGKPAQTTCSVTGINRTDIDSWTTDPTSNSSAKILVNIIAFDKNNSNKLTWNFSYGNFGGLDPYNLPPNYTYNEVGTTHRNRLRLDKITIPDGNTYTFDYNSMSSTRFTYGVDHWGYMNGQENNFNGLGLIGTDFLSTCGSNRESNQSIAIGGSLSKISNSAGTETNFTYELNTARNYTVNGGNVGGLRIKQLETKDLLRSTSIIKKYDYANSGFLFIKPIYHFDSPTNDRNRYANSALYGILLNGSLLPVMGYKNVTESVYDGVNNFLGKTTYIFGQKEVERTIEGAKNDCVTGSCYAFTAYMPNQATAKDGYDYQAGSLLESSSYNRDNNQISKQVNTYTPLDQAHVTRTYRGKNVQKLNGLEYGEGSYGAYSNVFRKYRLQKQVTTVFSPSNSNDINVTTTDYTYKEEMPGAYITAFPGNHNQVVKTTTTDDFGYPVETITKYAADFDFSTHIPATGTEARGIYELKLKQMLYAPIEVITKRNNKVVAATYQSYTNPDTYTGLPKATYSINNTALTSFSEITYNSSTDAITKDSNYGEEKINFLQYNPFGLLERYQVKYGATTEKQYTYQDLVLYSETKNVGISDALTTSYNYSSALNNYSSAFNQLSRVVAPNGLEKKYGYDALGRLLTTKTKDNYLLQRYIYKWSDASPLGSISPTTTANYSIMQTARKQTTVEADLNDYTNAVTNVAYTDGFGRTIENIAYKVSPSLQSILTGVNDLDNSGRPIKSYLPAITGTYTGEFLPLSIIPTFAGISYNNDTYPYTEYAYPTAYSTTSISPGSVSRISTKTKINYDVLSITAIRPENPNTSLIRRYKLTADGRAINSVDSYGANYALQKNIQEDEEGNQIVTYSDKEGRKIQVDVRSAKTGDADMKSTAYVYDDAGRLCYIIPPKAFATLGTTTFNESSTAFLSGMYAFHYDAKGRVYETYKPNGGWTYHVYNKLGQEIMTQDPLQRETNIWTWTKYDGHGRKIMCGVINFALSQNTLQSTFDSNSNPIQFEERSTVFGSVGGYTNRIFPNAFTISGADVKNVYYYDDYTWNADASYNFQYYKTNQWTNVKGLPTGSLVRNLSDNSFLKSITYYDDRNRAIQTTTQNRFGGLNQVDRVYNFAGDVLEERTIYRKPNTTNVAVLNKYDYDHVGRKTAYYSGVSSTDNPDTQPIATYTYDPVGRLQTKTYKTGASVGISLAPKVYLQGASFNNSATIATTNLLMRDDLRLLNQIPLISPYEGSTVPARLKAKSTVVPPASSVFGVTGNNAIVDWVLVELRDPANKSLVNSRSALLQRDGDVVDTDGFSVLDIPAPSNYYHVAIKHRNHLGVMTANPVLFGSTAFANKPIQTDYTYNISVGQVKQQNTHYQNSTIPLLKIDYYRQDAGAYYNGSLNKQTWTNSSNEVRNFTYTYDNFNRLTAATYLGIGNESYSVSNITYDDNGNIKTLTRNGLTSTITQTPPPAGSLTWGVIDDNLTYTYKDATVGNQLQSINEGSNGRADKGFFDQQSSPFLNDYTYKSDGSLNSDANKFLSQTDYNYMGLPDKIYFNNNSKFIQNMYDAEGVKLRKTLSNGNTTDYMGDLLYENDVLKSISHDEGRYIVSPSGVDGTPPQFFETDNLGNTRLIFSNTGQVVQETHYGPWGEVLEGIGTQGDWNFLYQGNEYVNDFNYGTYDFNARQYDAWSGRFTSLDPANQFASGYVGMGNMPTMATDPDGQFAFVPLLIGVGIAALKGAAISTAVYGITSAIHGSSLSWSGLGKAALGGAIGGATGFGIGTAFGATAGFGHELLRAGAHGLASVAQGGNFLSGATSSLIGSYTGGIGNAWAQIGIGGVSGGLGAVIGGGDFWRGFENGAITTAVNHLMHDDPIKRQKQREAQARQQAQQEAKDFTRDFITDMMGDNAESILKNRSAYGQALSKTIIRSKVGFNVEVGTEIIGVAKYAKYASKGFAAYGLYEIGQKLNNGSYSGNYGWLATDAVMWGVGTFGGPMGTGASVMYNVGKAYYGVGVK